MVRNNLLSLQEQLTHAVGAEAADSLPSNSTQAPGFHPTRQLLLMISEDLDALDSIYQCALAQERISNDVLSLGKMQLDLLRKSFEARLTTDMFDVETSIPSVARKVMSLFQNEARMNRISLELDVSPSFENLGIGPVMTDPVRLSQIVTNLLSNAIRFTANSQERRIVLRVDVSLHPPEEGCRLRAAADTGAGPVADVSAGTPVYVAMSGGCGIYQADDSGRYRTWAQARGAAKAVPAVLPSVANDPYCVWRKWSGSLRLS